MDGPSAYSIQKENHDHLPITERRKKSDVLRNLLFGSMVVGGQCGQNVVLPLFIDSARYDDNSTSLNHSFTAYKPFMDSYAVTVFSTIMFAIVFGVLFAVRRLRMYLKGECFDRRVPHRLIALSGLLAGFAGLIIVYSSSGKRTAPYLQAILVNAAIPATLILRYLLLKKSPTKQKLICALTIVLAIFICLLPSLVPEIDPKQANNKEQGGTTGWRGIFWPCCFMMGFVITAVGYTIQEKIFQYQNPQSTKKVDIFYIMFISMLFQLVACVALFWTDAIPIFGNVNSIEKVFLNFVYGFQCVFGSAGCSHYPALYGWLFIACFVCYWLGSGCLLRYSEGATFLAIVTAIVTPTGFLFWTLFKEQPTFHWHPQMSVTVWLNIIGLAIMVPSIYLYNVERSQAMKSFESQKENFKLDTCGDRKPVKIDK
ncbi:Crt-like 1 [Exaiptasia diaphana]|nr:Crt-like 1 [Exaiptasia diaphana]